MVRLVPPERECHRSHGTSWGRRSWSKSSVQIFRRSSLYKPVSVVALRFPCQFQLRKLSSICRRFQIRQRWMRPSRLAEGSRRRARCWHLRGDHETWRGSSPTVWRNRSWCFRRCTPLWLRTWRRSSWVAQLCERRGSLYLLGSLLVCCWQVPEYKKFFLTKRSNK